MAPSCLSTLIASFVCLVTIQSLRQSRNQNARTKYVAGIPVHNYQWAHIDDGLDGMASQEVVWTIWVDPNTSDETIHGLCLQADCLDEGQPREGGVPFFAVRASEEELEHLLESAAADVIKFVEPDFEVEGSFDVMEGDAMDVETQRSLWGLSKIGVSSRGGTGRGVHIYVLDTGVRWSHNDFGGRALPGYDNINNKKQSCSSSSSSCSADRQGHGTHCAGTAAGSKLGVASGSRVYGVKVLGDNGKGSSSWIYGGLNWASRSGRKPGVASMSLGGSGRSSGYKTAVDAAVNNGVVVSVAAGNEKSNACNYSPAYVPNALTVGSTDSRDQRSGFSNWGSCVNIWAPGTSITSAGHNSNSEQTRKSGTSMACPAVSGAAALVLAVNPKWRPRDVLSALRNNARKGTISGLKSGDTNTLLSVRGLGGGGPSPAPPSSPSPPSGPSPSPPSGGTRRRRRRRSR